MTAPTIAVLATLDTKGDEARFLAEQIEALGATPWLLDLGVVGTPTTAADVSREEIARAGGSSLEAMLSDPTRQATAPIVTGGATKLLQQHLARGALHGVIGLGGTQGTSTCSRIMHALPYGLPKLIVSTVAAGDTSAFVGVKDITMMWSVGDLLGLNAFTRTVLRNAAGAIVGMASEDARVEQTQGDRPLIGLTNLGVLTEGAQHALRFLDATGFEAIVFHAVGSGGRAMEQMMREGLLAGVLDYALGEIADDVFGGLRAGGKERLTVAGPLGLPQVLCPGGVEHIGLLVEPNTVPARWQHHRHVFHSPIVLAPRLRADELEQVAAEIGRRLAGTRGDAVMLLPLRGTSRYGVEGGPLHEPEGDRAFFTALRAHLPPTVEVVEHDTHAEDPAFVEAAVSRLVEMVNARS